MIRDERTNIGRARHERGIYKSIATTSFMEELAKSVALCCDIVSYTTVLR